MWSLWHTFTGYFLQFVIMLVGTVHISKVIKGGFQQASVLYYKAVSEKLYLWFPKCFVIVSCFIVILSFVTLAGNISVVIDLEHI